MTRGPIIEAEEFKALVAAANRDMRNSYMHRTIGGESSGAPRFELYHSAPSLCSHKVRTVLAELGLTYKSHDMVIMPAGKFIPENYRPGYVRLRLGAARGEKYVSGYTGESSVTNQGVDPCVVPTLVDHEARRVVIDSNDICHYIDEVAGDRRLVPDDNKDEIDRQIRLIDEAPHVALLYGAHPDNDIRPEGLAERITGVHARKLRVLEALIEHVGDDPELLEAYQSKIAKESAAGEFMVDDEGMRRTHRDFEAHAGALETILNGHDQAWSCGAEFSMADIMWTASLYRMKWIGLGHLWEGANPRVAEYTERAFQRPSFVAAVAAWRGAYAPSKYVDALWNERAKRQFALHTLRAMKWSEVTLGDRKIKLKPLPEASAHAGA